MGTYPGYMLKVHNITVGQADETQSVVYLLLHHTIHILEIYLKNLKLFAFMFLFTLSLSFLNT